MTFTNNSDAELDGQLIFVAEGEDHSDEEVVAELQKAVEGQPVADWFQGGGGPGFAGKGESSTATREPAGRDLLLRAQHRRAPGRRR